MGRSEAEILATQQQQQRIAVAGGYLIISMVTGFLVFLSSCTFLDSNVTLVLKDSASNVKTIVTICIPCALWATMRYLYHYGAMTTLPLWILLLQLLGVWMLRVGWRNSALRVEGFYMALHFFAIILACGCLLTVGNTRTGSESTPAPYVSWNDYAYVSPQTGFLMGLQLQQVAVFLVYAVSELRRKIEKEASERDRNAYIWGSSSRSSRHQESRTQEEPQVDKALLAFYHHCPEANALRASFDHHKVLSLDGMRALYAPQQGSMLKEMAIGNDFTTMRIREALKGFNYKPASWSFLAGGLTSFL